jgi:hypothetical protein
VRQSLVVLSVLVACGACTAQPDEQVLGPNAEVTVCVGTSGQHAAGDDAHLELVSQGEVLSGAVLTVPGEVVLLIPDTAPEPRMLLDGEEWASSPQGGGWGVSRGEGCPVT